MEKFCPRYEPVQATRNLLFSGRAKEVMLLLYHIMHAVWGAVRETIWKTEFSEGALQPWYLGKEQAHQAAHRRSPPCQAEQISRVQPTHGIHPAFQQPHCWARAEASSSTAALIHLPCISPEQTRTLPLLLPGKALAVWPGWGAQRRRHSAPGQATPAAERGKGGKEAQRRVGLAPGGLQLLQRCRLGSSAFTFSQR